MLPAGRSGIQNVQTCSGAHPASYFMSIGVPSRTQNARGVRLTIHLHLEPTIRKSGVIPLLSPYIPSRRTQGQIDLSHPSELRLINDKLIIILKASERNSGRLFYQTKKCQ